jgi:hypothetical protein
MSDDSASEVPRQESWSTGDWRTLLITVIGGVAANIGTVLIVGLSLALLHLFQAGPHANPTPGVRRVLGICGGFRAVGVTVSRRLLSPMRSPAVLSLLCDRSSR